MHHHCRVVIGSSTLMKQRCNTRMTRYEIAMCRNLCGWRLWISNTRHAKIAFHSSTSILKGIALTDLMTSACSLWKMHSLCLSMACCFSLVQGLKLQITILFPSAYSNLLVLPWIARCIDLLMHAWSSLARVVLRRFLVVNATSAFQWGLLHRT